MRRVRVSRSLAGAVALLAGFAAPLAEAEPVAFARDLAVSPAGETLAFSWAGDLWTVPIEGGAAKRLTVHPGQDTHPVWSPDGRRLAFASDQHGTANVFVMGPGGEGVQRLTFSNAASGELPTDWSPDGTWIYFHAAREGDVYAEERVYRVPAAGGQAWRALDCFAAGARLSPDGTRMAFVRGGWPWARPTRRGYRGSGNLDIFLCTTEGETFARLTDFDGMDRLPIWDAEGRGVYFLSDCGGTVNVWYQPVDMGAAEQITRMTGDDVRGFSVSSDGKTLAYTHWDRIYVMSTADRRARAIEVTAGGDLPRNDVEPRTFTKDADEHAVAPDGKEIALVVRGEVFVIKTEEKQPTRRVTDGPARDQDVAWSPDGKAFFFVSDRDGQEDVYRAVSAEVPPKALSESLRFKIERVTDNPELEYRPAVSPDGEKLAFVRGRGDLIIRDLKSGAEAVLLESWNTPSFRWSPDSKWMAYEIEDVEHNSDVWVVAADGGTPAVNVSQHPDYDGGPQWSADGQMLAYASRRHGFDTDLYVVFLAPTSDEKSAVERDAYFKERAKAVKKRKPPESVAASGEIALAGHVPETQPTETQPAETQPVATQPTGTQPAATQPAATRPTTAPAAEEEADELRAKVRQWVQEYLEEREGKEKKPDKKKKKAEKDKAAEDDEEEPACEWELDTCYRRVRRVTSLPGDQSRFALAPDGQTLAFSSAHEGDPKLYTIKWNSKDLKRIQGARVGALRWGYQGQRLYYLRNGVSNSCAASGSGAKTHAFRAKVHIAHSAEAVQKFDDAARQVGLRFYHPTMKGLDWPALARKYRDLALRTHTVSEFNEVFNMLLGELNASHLGIRGPRAGGRREAVGRLGCAFDRTFAGPGLKVAEVLPRSPADHMESTLVPGDVLLQVSGQPVGPGDPLERALINTVGDEVIIEFVPSPERAEEQKAPSTDGKATGAQEADTGAEVDSTETRELVIRPTSFGRIRNLKYDVWVRDNAAHVEEKSDGRVGYLHIRSMNTSSFDVFERDLYAAAHGKEGLIIDVRSNGGGWTADWVLAVLSVERHAYTVSRGGAPGYPQDRLIFYAWTKPATMMCNQQSFSNAEIVSHAFKNLGRGPLVGMPTYGGVISTGAYALIDGAYVRMPTRGWYTLPDGIDMENHGAEPDVKVAVTPDDEVRGLRPQLDAAVAATLAQLGQ